LCWRILCDDERTVRILTDMSIALSTVVHPSKRLLVALYAFCGAIVAAAALTTLGVAGNFLFSARLIIAALSLMGVTLAVILFQRQQKTWRIHISPEGIIRLHQESGERDQAAEPEMVFRLMPVSTLWPSLLLLNLESEGGQTLVLRILPDSVLPQEFRALSVALRWIAARRGQGDGEGLSEMPV